MKSNLNDRAASRRLRLAGTAALALALATSGAGAQETTDKQSEAYRASMAQGDVKRDAATIQAELVNLRDQMRQLMPDDVAAVDRAIEKMQSLSKEEMEGAIIALQEASRSKDARNQVEKISGALKKQGVVSTALKQLSVELQARETLESIAAELSNLVRREVSVLQEIGRLGNIQQMPAELHAPRHKESFEVAKEDQNGITADLKLLGRKLALLSKDFGSDPHNGIVQAADVATKQKLTEDADQALALTAGGPFNGAVAAQTKVIKTLIAMQQALTSEQDPLDRLKDLAGRLERAAADQKEVMDAVMLIGEKQDLERNYKRMQADLGDEVVAVRFELEPLNNMAAGQLVSAQDAIDKALLNYVRMWEEHMDARVNTQEAHKNILAAIKLLSDQIARTENGPKTPAELAAQLDQLQRAVAAAAVQQAQNARQPQPSAAQQQSMKERVDSLQQSALPISPEAAKSLGEAAQQLPTTTPAAQMAAAQKLAEAAQELAQQKADLAALAQAESQVDKALELTEKAQENLENKQTAAAANALDAAKQNAQAAEKAAAQAAPEAAKAMGEAGKNLEQANMDAAQTKGDAAKAQAQAAADALAKAKAGLAQAMSDLPGMPQMTPGTPSPGQDNPQAKGKNQAVASQSGGGNADNLLASGKQGGPVEVLAGLTPQDRNAVSILQKESPPREFVPDVQQYYKNIADGAGL